MRDPYKVPAQGRAGRREPSYCILFCTNSIRIWISAVVGTSREPRSPSFPRSESSEPGRDHMVEEPVTPSCRSPQLEARVPEWTSAEKRTPHARMIFEVGTSKDQVPRFGAFTDEREMRLGTVLAKVRRLLKYSCRTDPFM